MHGVFERMRGNDLMPGRRRTYRRNEDRIQQLKANYELDHDMLVFLTNARLCINPCLLFYRINNKVHQFNFNPRVQLDQAKWVQAK